MSNKKQPLGYEVGTKFINPTKKRWPIQVSAIDDDIIAVSWLEEGNIRSTFYEKQEVAAYMKQGLWEIAPQNTDLNHP